jgi:hypothetical protein
MDDYMRHGGASPVRERLIPLLPGTLPPLDDPTPGTNPDAWLRERAQPAEHAVIYSGGTVSTSGWTDDRSVDRCMRQARPGDTVTVIDDPPPGEYVYDRCGPPVLVRP